MAALAAAALDPALAYYERLMSRAVGDGNDHVIACMVASWQTALVVDCPQFCSAQVQRTWHPIWLPTRSCILRIPILRNSPQNRTCNVLMG